MNLVVSLLVGVSAAGILTVWLLRQVRRGLGWLRNFLTPPGVTFGIADVPLTAHEWQRFAALATAKNIQQKTLLAECIKFYLSEKVK